MTHASPSADMSVRYQNVRIDHKISQILLMERWGDRGREMAVSTTWWPLSLSLRVATSEGTPAPAPAWVEPRLSPMSSISISAGGQMSRQTSRRRWESKYFCLCIVKQMLDISVARTRGGRADPRPGGCRGGWVWPRTSDPRTSRTSSSRSRISRCVDISIISTDIYGYLLVSMSCPGSE